jgi:hypothetical protein
MQGDLGYPGREFIESAVATFRSSEIGFLSIISTSYRNSDGMYSAVPTKDSSPDFAGDSPYNTALAGQGPHRAVATL